MCERVNSDHCIQRETPETEFEPIVILSCYDEDKRPQNAFPVSMLTREVMVNINRYKNIIRTVVLSM